MFTQSIPADHPLRSVSVPLKPKPHRQNVGLRPSANWLLRGPDTPWQLTHKRHLFAVQGDTLLGVIPGFEQHAVRASEAIARASLAEAEPVEVHGSSPFAGEVTPAVWTTETATQRLRHVTETVSEDICVMSATEEGWLLTGVAVAFPSHWSPVAKLGRTLDGIHDPVPGYPRIAKASSAAFDRIAAHGTRSEAVPSAIWERFNWTLVPDGELCHPEVSAPAIAAQESPLGAEQLWLRVERQTLTAVAETLVVFAIRTFLTPLPDLTGTERSALVESLSGVSHELAKYRGWVGYGEKVRRWVGSS